MANHKSALKKAKQDAARRLRNRAHRSRLRTALKKIRATIAQGDADGARALLPAAAALIDKTAARGVLHENAAARYKSRLQKAIDGLTG